MIGMPGMLMVGGRWVPPRGLPDGKHGTQADARPGPTPSIRRVASVAAGSAIAVGG